MDYCIYGTIINHFSTRDKMYKKQFYGYFETIRHSQNETVG
jgi:hypothetical protein